MTAHSRAKNGVASLAYRGHPVNTIVEVIP
jgi:hypothetical protein